MRNVGVRLLVIGAACIGFCVASVTAFGYAKLKAWRDNGDKFQLGYVVGYLDGVNLCQHGDPRAMVPTGGRPDYERYRDGVNAFFADPANANRGVPDAMRVIGAKVQAEIMQNWQKHREEAARRAHETGGRTAEPTPDASAPPPPDVPAR